MSSTLTETNIGNLALDILKESPMTDADSDATPESLWFLRNYATARDAELKAHPWRFAIARRQLYALDYPVDDAMSGTLSGAWGLSRLTPHWSGLLAKLRRSSDSTTDTFTFAEGELSIDSDDVGTFIGTGSGYIDTLYDQSGNGRPLIQASTTKQPGYDGEIGDAEVPGFTFDGSNDLLACASALSTQMSTTVGYMVVVGMVDALTLDSATASANHVLAADSTNKMGLYVRTGGALYGQNDDGSADATTDAIPNLSEPFVAEWRHTGGIVYSRINKGTERQATSGTTSSLAGFLNVGDDASGSQALTGSVFAILTFSVIPTAAERDRIVERLMRWVGASGYARAPSAWTYRYPIPDDCLTFLPLRTDGMFEGMPVSHEVEKGYLLTDSSVAYARFIQRITDTTRFDPLFVEALSAKLAFKWAHWITGKASMAQTAKALYDDAIARAVRADSFEGTPERPYDDDVIAARYAVGGGLASDWPITTS